MRILFTTPILEHPAAGGPQLRIENSIKALSSLCELDVVSRCPPSLSGGEPAASFYRGLCQEYHVSPTAIRRSANRVVRKAQMLLGEGLRTDARADAQYILDHVDRRGIELVWLGYGNISYQLIRELRRRRPTLKMICDTDSVWSRFVLRELPYARGLRKLRVAWSGRRKVVEEKAWVRLCDITTAVSEVDAAYYREIAEDPSRIRIFSNVIDLETYREAPAAASEVRSPSIYLAGTFGHANSPMDVAARWILQEVLPLVRKEEPDTRLFIVGTRSDQMFGHLDDPDIVVTGKVPSVLPFLCHADVALVPLKFESGTRFKILEAAACRVPVVSTTLGAEGLPVSDGEHLLLADDASSFAVAILRLLGNRRLAEELAQNSRDLVESDYSVDALRCEARAILEVLAI